MSEKRVDPDQLSGSSVSDTLTATEDFDGATPEVSLEILDADVPDEDEQADTDDIGEVMAAERSDSAVENANKLVQDNQTYIKQEKTDKPLWYVVYTYSGYEKKVMTNLQKTIQNHNLQNTIIDVKVPEEDTIETKNGKRRHVTRKLYPGYVMVKMYLTDDAWYVVRNTRGVTGFVGPASKPLPLSDTEVRAMGIENVRISLDVSVGDSVMVTGGPFENFVGEVEAVDTEKQSVRVRVSLFGRDVPMDLDFVLVKKI